MTSSRGAVHAARSVDELMAAEWALEDLKIEQIYPDMGGDVGLDPAVLEALRAEAAAEAEAEIERRVSAAYARGFEEGRREGELAEMARLQNAARTVEMALDEIRESEERWVGSVEENICAVAVAVARQVLDQELKMDRSAIEQLVRRALAEFPIDQPVRIRVNPLDLTAIGSRSAAEPGLPTTLADREVHWLADSRVAPGGCVVEGKDRIVDGRVDNALERIYRRLTYANA